MTDGDAGVGPTNGAVDAPTTDRATKLRGLASPVSGVGVLVCGGLLGAPAWVVCVLGSFGLAVLALQNVFPQESADRLAWWRDRRRSRERAAIRRAETAARRETTELSEPDRSPR